MLRLFQYSIFTVLCWLPKGVQARVLDRLVLEVNGKSYSQRQIELYQTLRIIASGVRDNAAIPRSSNWSQYIEIFRNEMIIYSMLENNLELFDGLTLDNRGIQRVQDRVYELTSQDLVWKNYLNSHGFNSKEMTDCLIRIFKIQAFLRDRAGLSPVGQSSQIPWMEVNTQVAWFSDLQQSTAYRLYNRGGEFQLLQSWGN